MREPFESINPQTKHYDQNGNEITQFRPSRLSGCFEDYWWDLQEDIPISDELNEIFDFGNTVHYEREYLNHGARKVISSEKVMKIMHKSGLFILKGQADSIELDSRGFFIKDYKSTKLSGFSFFLKDGWSIDYIKQLSIYSYMNYVCEGVYLDKGVIEKVDKFNPRNYLALEHDLFPLDRVRDFILKHPVILYYFEKISEEVFLRLAVQEMTGKTWKCTNCAKKGTKCRIFDKLK